jgi:tetratricopeptide (TPR) repeat protein
MNFKKQIILFCIITVIGIPFNNLISQTVQQKPTRQSSFEAFSQGNYEKAYSEFRELLLTYTKDPLYKYYSGVCLVKLNKNPGEAVTLLQQALQGTGDLKTLPSDGLFYLGRAQQMSGKYTEASVSYNLYTDKAGKKSAREMGVPELLQQCTQKKGQIADSEINPPEIIKPSKADSIKPETKLILKGSVQNNAAKETIVKETLPPNYDIIMGEAIDFQFKADSVSSIINEQKKGFEKLSGAEKEAMKVKIAENEKNATSLQSKADQKYREAKTVLNPGQDSVKKIKESSENIYYKAVMDATNKPEPKNIKVAEKQTDSAKVALPNVKSVEIYSLFEVLAKPVTDPKAKIAIDPEVPAGLIYRIQIAVFRNPVQPAFFKGITPVYGFKIAGTDKTTYYVGMFRKSADAAKALASVKAKGFKDAFVIPLTGNKSVSADRAAILEKEWGKKPFITAEPVTHADTVTPTLTFRVEVTRSVKPLKEDVVDGIRKVAGNRGLDILILEDGKTGYVIGKFITFETAAEYSDLLKRNGYKDAQVVAWLGKKQIPVDTARQLVDKLR